MANSKTFLNMFWSFRRYLYAQFPTIPQYYNPVLRPKEITSDKFLVVSFQDDRIGGMSFSFPRIFCVTKNDPDGILIAELVSTVVDKLDRPTTGKRTFQFTNESGSANYGTIEVKDVTVRPALPYSEGFVHRAVDVILLYQVEARHVFS